MIFKAVIFRAHNILRFTSNRFEFQITNVIIFVESAVLVSISIEME